jgi:hypothetical protein
MNASANQQVATWAKYLAGWAVCVAVLFVSIHEWQYHGATAAQGLGDVVELSASSALTSGELIQGDGGATASASGFTPDTAGTAGTTVNNAGNSTDLARADHEHRMAWSIGMAFEATPSTGEFAMPLPVNDQCGATDLDVESFSITALTKGSGTLTFNVVRYNNAGSSQGNLFSSTQSYSNAGNNRQDFTTNLNDNNIGTTDFFRFNIITVNGQDDFTVIVQGLCRNGA